MKYAALAIASLAVLALLWLAVETRYGSCVEKAPITVDVDSSSGSSYGGLDAGPVKIKGATVERDTEGCWHP